MKTLIKVVLVLFVLFVLLVIGGVLLVAKNIDSLVKTGIERGGSYAAGVPTTVDSVDVGLFSGTLGMDGLTIGNPEGFSTPHFLSLGGSDVELELASLTSDKVHVPKVKLSGIDVYLDKGGNPSNYNAILNNLKQFEGSGEAAPKDAEGANKALLIDSLVLEDINIHVANMPGVSMLTGDVAVKIPQIELKNIGQQERMKTGDVVNLVIKTVLSAAVEAGGGIIPGDVLGDLTSGLAGLESLQDLGIEAIGDLSSVFDGVGEQAQQAVDDLKKQGEQAVDDAKKQVEDAVDETKKNIEKELGNIFGNKKKDDEDDSNDDSDG